ncbi:unnamed protein product [Prunus armeniaca]|uniref:Retrotransposon gag domain-containing protein n=1 Tax=Prunus armeniaca TaxID=36596 RepID=A0A6J5X4W6_PRUAR|nr:unnamed protein product [Prunus armeniaca]
MYENLAVLLHWEDVIQFYSRKQRFLGVCRSQAASSDLGRHRSRKDTSNQKKICPNRTPERKVMTFQMYVSRKNVSKRVLAFAKWLIELQYLQKSAFHTIPSPNFHRSCDPLQYRISLASSALQNDAREWWSTICDRDEVTANTMSWDEFECPFYDHYLLPLRKVNIMEFLELEQGDMSVADYSAKFNEFGWFVPSGC